MKITHINNSFILIETANVRLCCDPWVGIGNHGGWQSFPEYKRGELIDLVRSSDAVYISHLHSDHLDPRFLADSGLLDRDIFIKRFAHPTMANRLAALGASEVHQLEPFSPFVFRDIELTIVPQMSSTSESLHDDVNYDMDTSLVAFSQGCTFFNQVDNPLSAADAKKVADWVGNRYGKINVAALVVGAAGEYPQCFINVDREQEQKRIIKSSFRSLDSRLEAFKPDVFFPAGGTYIIPGKMSGLNRYIAQPGFDEIAEHVALNHAQTHCLNLEGGLQLTVDKSTSGCDTMTERRISPIEASPDQAVQNHAADKYEHEGDPQPSDDGLPGLFADAAANWARYIESNAIEVNSKIVFALYRDLRLGDDLRPSTTPTHTFTLMPANRDEKGELVIHMDATAFVRCIHRRANWNQTLSGSLCLFERTPNVHYPSDLFSLNSLVLR